MNPFIDIPQISDERGSLCVAEWSDLPFEPRRAFWIYGVGKGKTRAGHAHALCAEVIFCVRGSFDIFVDDGAARATHHMDTPRRGIHIAPGTWCELSNFTRDAVCLVLASHEYIKDGYINSYDDFLKSTNNHG